MKKVCITIVLLAALILGGCATNEQLVIQPGKPIISDIDFRQPGSEPGNTERKTQQKLAETTNPGRTVDSNKTEWPNSILSRPKAYDIITGSVPAELESLLEEHKNNKGYFAKEIDGMWYVAFFMGGQKTGGYELNIEAVEENEGETLIKVAEVEPGEDDIVLMAPTYPLQVIRIKDSIIPDFTVINQNGEIYPELVMLNQ